MTNHYPDRYRHLRAAIKDLAEAAPGPMAGFAALHAKAVAGGALDARTKELIALAIAVAVRCDGCVAYHVHDALAAGATREELAEAVGVAVMMGGGPAVVYGAEALEAAAQFEVESRSAPAGPDEPWYR
jgi:AhpD family alkylhydroperoxidase